MPVSPEYPLVAPDPFAYILVGTAIVLLALFGGATRRWIYELRASAAALERQKREMREQMSRQKERELIAHEMHDTVAHQLSLVCLRSSVLEVETDNNEVRQGAQEIRENAHYALEEMRLLIHTLKDSQTPILNKDPYTGIRDAWTEIDDLVIQARRAGAKIDYRSVVEKPEVSQAVEHSLFRMVQEGITNALRYGQGPLSVKIIANLDRGRLALTITNLIAPNAENVGSGTGLISLNERALVLNGTMSAAAEGAYWKLEVTLPLASHKSEDQEKAAVAHA